MLSFLSACDTGAFYADRSSGTASLEVGGASIASGDSEISLDEYIDIVFSRTLYAPSVSDESAYLVLLGETGGENSTSTACETGTLVPTRVRLVNTSIRLEPISALLCGHEYAVCATSNIKFEADISYVGSTFVFDTIICAPSISNIASTTSASTGSAITPLTFVNAGGDASSCSVSPNLPAGLSLSVVGGTCQISGTPTDDEALQTYTVTASNSTGSDTGSVSIVVLQATPPDASGFVASSIQQTQMDLSWTSGGDTTAGFRIQYASGLTAPSDCSSAQISLGNVTTTTVTGLSPGTAYSFRICAINSNPTPNLSGGTTLSGRWTLANNPTLNANTVASTSVGLSWAAASGASSYRVSRASGSTAPATCATPTYSPAGTSQSDPGLTPGTQYSYRICSVNANGDLSAGSTTSSWTLAAEATAGSTIITAISIQMNWSSAVGAVSYWLSRQAGAVPPAACDPGTYTTFQTPGTSQLDFGLSQGAQYSYRLCTVNANSDVSSGITFSHWTNSGEVSLNAISSDTSSITLGWSVGGDVTAVRLKIAAGATAPADCASGYVTASGNGHTFSGLSPGTQHSVRICTLNGNGDLSSGITVSKWVVPDAPATFAGSSASGDDITFSLSSGLGSNSGYYIKRAAGTTPPTSCSSPNYVVSAGATSATVTLPTRGQYAFLLCAINGASPSPDISAGISTTYWTVPENPATFGISGVVGSATIPLAWTSGSGGNNGYRLVRTTGSTPPANCNAGYSTFAAGVLSTNDTGLSSGTEYQYLLCAVNGNPTPQASSGVSLSSSRWTVPDDPTVNIDDTQPTTADISWSVVGGSYQWLVQYDLVSGLPGGVVPLNCPSGTVYSGATLSTQLTGLTAGENYAVRVCNRNNNSPQQVTSGTQTTFSTPSSMFLMSSSVPLEEAPTGMITLMPAASERELKIRPTITATRDMIFERTDSDLLRLNGYEVAWLPSFSNEKFLKRIQGKTLEMWAKAREVEIKPTQLENQFLALDRKRAKLHLMKRDDNVQSFRKLAEASSDILKNANDWKLSDDQEVLIVRTKDSIVLFLRKWLRADDRTRAQEESNLQPSD